MTPIPLNNKTMNFSFEAFKNIQIQNEEARKVKEEKKKRERQYNKEVKPFKEQLNHLRNEELKKLKSNEDFIKRCKAAKKNGDLTKDYREEIFTGGCGGTYKCTDLIYEYGSKEFREKSTELNYEISKRNYLLYQ